MLDLTNSVSRCLLWRNSATWRALASSATATNESPACGTPCKPKNLHRERRRRRVDFVAVIVDHRAHLAVKHAADKGVADMQRAFLHQHGRHRTSAAVELGFDDGAARQFFRIGFELQNIGLQLEHFQQMRNAFVGLGRHRREHRVAAPIFGGQAVFGQTLFDFFQIGIGPVHLVDRDDDRHLGRARMVDRFHRLRHDAVVGGDDQHDDIGDLGAARAHGGKRFMARRIEKRHAAAVDLDVISADMLGDAAMLLGRHVGAANGVEQGGLAVIDVTHDRHHRRARQQRAFLLFRLMLDSPSALSASKATFSTW